jgi:Fe-S-cluster containining protein
MSDRESKRHPGGEEGHSPALWNIEQFRENVFRYAEELTDDPDNPVPKERVLLQLDRDPEFQTILQKWHRLCGAEKVRDWKRVLELAETHAREILPSCLMCGECCRRGSPTLHVEDLSLLREGKIPWDALYTLRRGEPVHSPFKDELFFLLDERIKLREKPGGRECLFLDGDTQECTIYAERPLQCRAQACWDPKPGEELTAQPYLTRRDIFSEVEILWDLLEEHDRRCAFEKLSAAFKALEETRGQAVDQVLELLAYEDHFRNFVAEKLSIPRSQMELVFGRSFADLVQVFGFRVETEADGTRVLVPDAPPEKTEKSQ